MYYIEPEELLVAIYTASYHKIEYEFSQEAVKLFNLLFLGRDKFTFKPLGYMTPKCLVRYKNEDLNSIEYPYANTFYQEQDYPYILYAQHIDGWFAYLHLCGIRVQATSISPEVSEEILTIADMFKGISLYEHRNELCSNIMTDNTTLYDWIKYGILPSSMKTRETLYYPEYHIPYAGDNGSWSNGPIACCSRKTLMERIRKHLPEVFKYIELDDTCFIAGGFLSTLSNEGVYEFYEHHYYTGDIDLFIVRGQHNGYDKLKQIIQTLQEHKYNVKNDGYTFICETRCGPDIQICPVSYVNLMDVIDNFDTSCSSIAFNGKELFATDNFKRYIRLGQSFCKFNHMRASRYEKYKERGYELVFDGEFSLTQDQPKHIGETTDMTNCFDRNLFHYLNHKDGEIYHPYYATTWVERFQPKDYTEEKANLTRDLCNKLAQGYYENPYVNLEHYNRIMEMHDHSSIDFYLYDQANYPYYIITGLDNDKAMRLFINIFPYPPNLDSLGLSWL